MLSPLKVNPWCKLPGVVPCSVVFCGALKEEQLQFKGSFPWQVGG